MHFLPSCAYWLHQKFQVRWQNDRFLPTNPSNWPFGWRLRAFLPTDSQKSSFGWHICPFLPTESLFCVFGWRLSRFLPTNVAESRASLHIKAHPLIVLKQSAKGPPTGKIRCPGTAKTSEQLKSLPPQYWRPLAAYYRVVRANSKLIAATSWIILPKKS